VTQFNQTQWLWRSSRIPLACIGLICAQLASGQDTTNRFSFDDYLVAPVRVHLLIAKESPTVGTTLLESDITRILGKLNWVWAQAGLHFSLESLVREDAIETAETRAGLLEPSQLLGLRPTGSIASNMFHIYYIKAMSMNGIYFPEAIFVKDTSSLRSVPGGIDEPLPRVTSHELGHAFGLPHRQDTTNLMASGTTGTWLNEEEIKQAREAARKCVWIEPAGDLMKRANTLFRTNQKQAAAVLYSRLAKIPVNDRRVELAKKRASEAIQPDSAVNRKPRMDTNGHE